MKERQQQRHQETAAEDADDELLAAPRPGGRWADTADDETSPKLGAGRLGGMVESRWGGGSFAERAAREAAEFQERHGLSSFAGAAPMEQDTAAHEETEGEEGEIQERELRREVRGEEQRREEAAASGGAGAGGPSSGPEATASEHDASRFRWGSQTATPPPSAAGTVSMLASCRSVNEFEKLNHIDEGTYGVVFRARDKRSGEVKALKKVKMEKEREGFPMTSLREINILLSFKHPNIVNVSEVVVGNSLDSIFMVMEFMEHDLKALMDSMRHPFTVAEVKCLMRQLLSGMAYLHDNWVLHRDLKTSNILYSNTGELKICDFGLARQYGSPLQPYSPLVVTLWYRAPELLLGARKYSTAVDMWSLGCIMAELLAKKPLLKGQTEIDQVDKMFKLFGTPTEAIWPGLNDLPNTKRIKFNNQPYNKLRQEFPAMSSGGRPALSNQGFHLLSQLLLYDPEKRISAADALNHPWFTEFPPPKEQELMPTYPTEKEGSARKRVRSPDPLDEQRRREELQEAMYAGGGLFQFSANN